MKSQKSLQKQRRLSRPLILRRVVGDSMLPTLRHGQVVLATGWFRALRIGDIIVLRHNGMEKIKRITKIKKTMIYVEGDNPNLSSDSRNFGWVERSRVAAKLNFPKYQSKHYSLP